MSKPWNELTESEQTEILDRIAEIYKEHGNPKWLKGPTFVTEVVNILNKN